MTKLFLIAIVIGTTYLGYWGYSTEQKGNPGAWMDIVNGTAQAPIQYRVGLVLPAYLVIRHTPLAFRHVFAAVDAVSGLVAVFTVLFLLKRSAAYKNGSETAQWFGVAAFAALVQFYFGWLSWYQRPETLLAAALLALSVLLLSVRAPLPGTGGYGVVALGQVVLALLMALVRPDLPFSLHAGVLLVCMASPRIGNEFPLPRWIQAGTSMLAALVSAGVQYYLAHVRYPGARYISGPMIELLNNIRHPSDWLPFGLFLLPLAWTLRTLFRNRIRPEGPAAGVLVGSLLFLCLWGVMGRIEEVRIFLPFALALLPLTVGLAIEQFAEGPAEDAA